ncbi:hypothetical protein AMK20_15025 [Streptomyces sp. TSRI0261]|nr:hypothetical protein AMK20_15025 [Streptomyces sp. TSRI0261]
MPPGEGEAEPDGGIEDGELEGEARFQGPYRVVLTVVIGGPEPQPFGCVGAVEEDGPDVAG